MFENIKENIDTYVRGHHYRQINSVVVYKDGKIVAQCFYNDFNEESRNPIRSVSKSIMSICTGIALDNGLLKSIDEPIYRFIPQFGEGFNHFHKVITVRHLLTMTSGIKWNGGVHYHCPMMIQMKKSGDWIAHIADYAVTSMPGMKYNYKEWDVILLAKILDTVCGDMYEYIDDKLFRPLGIKSQRWYKSPCGVYYSVADGDENDAESSSDLTALEMLNIGKLFLQHGIFDDKMIISNSFIEQTVAPLECNQGYGMLWWRGDNWYGCRGYGGQSITVLPKENEVIVTQATPTMRGMGYDDVIWEAARQACE